MYRGRRPDASDKLLSFLLLLVVEQIQCESEMVCPPSSSFSKLSENPKLLIIISQCIGGH